MTPEKKGKLYAIGLKGWVEIRRALKPPRPVITKASFQGVKRVPSGDYDPWTDLPIMRAIPFPSQIKITHFVGGRRLKVVSKRRFAFFIGMSPKVGEMMEIPEGLASISVLDKVMERDYD